MHYSKRYTQLLLTLPPELRENAIEYRQAGSHKFYSDRPLTTIQLKKLIKGVVDELVSLGLPPSLLQHLLGEGESSDSDGFVIPGLCNSEVFLIPEATYEFLPGANPIELQLRLRLKKSTNGREEFLQTGETHTIVLHSLHHSFRDLENGTKELVIPLRSDSAFFQKFSTGLQSLSSHLAEIHTRFVHSLKSLSKDISFTARPVSSSSSSFQPHSTTSDASSINISSPLFFTAPKTDLYAWREIFQLYAEAEVFESVHESDRGERSVEESEARLSAFVDRVTRQEFTTRWKFEQSKGALQTFLDLNIYIMNVKKFEIANAEAARKILKKHTKRTALPLREILPVCGAAVNQNAEYGFIHRFSTSLTGILVQAIGETLLPIVPQVDDYSCSICTSIAFKPIRLFCGHLFCVRCLVKMQKRGQDHCAMCRAPAVLKADRSNVDWALLNFMNDWFPEESKAKLKYNENEAAEEELQELGLDPNGCMIA